MKYTASVKIKDECEVMKDGELLAMPEFEADVFAEMTYSSPEVITADPYYSRPYEDDFEITGSEVKIINYGKTDDDGFEIEPTEEEKKYILEYIQEWLEDYDYLDFKEW